jgi:hypothetical protein
MSYSYLSNVYPGYTNTTHTISNKMYGNVTDTYNTNTPNTSQIVPIENFSNPGISTNWDSPQYNYTANGFSDKYKNNTLVPIPPLPKNQVYSGYQGTNVNSGELKQQISVENMSNDSGVSCQDYKYHLMHCQQCRMLNNTGNEFMDILAYIVFGIMLLLILERL